LPALTDRLVEFASLRRARAPRERA